MSRLTHHEGDIWTTTALAIGQGVNVRGVMGAGIAAQFSTKFPDMYQEYKRLCDTNTLVPGELHVWPVPRSSPDQAQRYVFNLASQINPGANASYRLILKSAQRALQNASAMGIDAVALPRIGSGIGGLDEAKVEGILEAVAQSYKADIELWTYKP